MLWGGRTWEWCGRCRADLSCVAFVSVVLGRVAYWGAAWQQNCSLASCQGARVYWAQCDKPRPLHVCMRSRSRAVVCNTDDRQGQGSKKKRLQFPEGADQMFSWNLDLSDSDRSEFS